MKLEFEYLPVDALKPYEKNARKHGKADIEVIKKSIELFGFNDPIGIWGKQNLIVEGHGRLMAAIELGMTEVPVIRLDHLTDEQRRMYALEHNRSAELSSWDFENLDAELEELSDFDLEDLGFAAFLPDDEPEHLEEDDFDEDEMLPENPYSQTGDIYVLGEHRVLCGNAANPDDIDKLMDGAIADCILTDPPYNVAYDANGTREGIDNDSMPDDAFRDLILNSYVNMYNHSKPGANIFVFHSDSKEVIFRTTLEEAGFKWHQNWQWVKQSLVLGHGWAHYRNEPIIVGWVPGAEHYVTGRRDLDTVLEFDRPTKSKEHPTMKPLDLLGYLLKEGSKKGDLVIDFFGGSGSTLIACEQLGRKCYTSEKAPKYVDVIVKRYVKYVGSSEGCYLLRNGERLELPQDFTTLL